MARSMSCVGRNRTVRAGVAPFDPRQEIPEVKDIARVPFACRPLTFDGTNFWTNHRAANEIVAFCYLEIQHDAVVNGDENIRAISIRGGADMRLNSKLNEQSICQRGR